MSDSRTNIRINDAETADALSAPIAAIPATRIFGNPAALDKAKFESRDTRAVGLRASLDALLLMDRLRFVRTLDLAFHLYASRSFTAALAAANNLMKRLMRNGFVSAHNTRVGGMRIYGIAQPGVNFLRDHTGHEAKAHRSLKDIKNPEHRLWANLIVITAEARGLTAMTEREVLAFEHASDELDLGQGQRREVGEGAVFDLAVFAIAFAEEVGGGRTTVGDLGDIHADIVRTMLG